MNLLSWKGKFSACRSVVIIPLNVQVRQVASTPEGGLHVLLGPNKLKGGLGRWALLMNWTPASHLLIRREFVTEPVVLGADSMCRCYNAFNVLPHATIGIDTFQMQ